MYPGEEVTVDLWETLESPDILLVGNSQLKPEHFLLRHADYQAIGGLAYPGKSALFDFLDVRQNGLQVPKAGRDVVSQRTFGKNSDRRDNVYIASLPDILAVGYRVYYAPVSSNGLHLRLVYGPHAGYVYPVMDTLPDVAPESRQAISQIWTKVNVY